MSKVYFTQIPLKNHHGRLIQTLNISTAEDFGEVVELMPPQTAFFNTKQLSKQLDNQLKDYDYDQGDVIVLLGDPVIMAATIAVLSKRRDLFAILKWDKNLRRYIKIVINSDI